jgi:hypothetical protein
MLKYGDTTCTDAIQTIDDGTYPLWTQTQGYLKSDVIEKADTRLYQHECFSFGDRPGVYSQEMQLAWRKAVDEHCDLWGAAQYPFIHRYYELIGADISRGRINELVDPLWYGEQEPFSGVSEEIQADIDYTAREL